MATTTYDVKIRYSVDSRGAGNVVGSLSNETGKLAREVRSTRGEFDRLARTVIGFLGAREAGRALVGFNATVQDTKLQIAGMLALTKKTDLVDQVERADRLYANLQRRAASLPGTTREYALMMGRLTQPITDAGLGLQALEDLTVNSVVGAKALSVEWEVAARDIDQALRGQFHSVDQFTGKLLGSIGYKGEEGRAKFNALSQDRRAAELQRSLMQPQLTQLAAAQGQTFRGVLSTLQDSLEQTVGKIGLPLFKQITTEIKRWNLWMDQNKDKVADIAKKLGDALVKGFSVVKDTVAFLISHAGTIMTIGKIWLATKVGSLLSTGVESGQSLSKRIASIGAALAPARDRFNPETGAYEFSRAGSLRRRATLGSVVGALPMLGQTAAIAFTVGSIIAEMTGLGRAFHNLTRSLDEERKELAANRQKTRDESIRRVLDNNPSFGPEFAALEGKRRDFAQLKAATDRVIAAQAQITKEIQSGRMYSGSQAKELSKAIDRLEDLGIGREAVTAFGGHGALSRDFGLRAAAIAEQQAKIQQTAADAMELGILSLTDYQRQTLDVQKVQQELLTYITRSLQDGIPIRPEHITELLRSNTDDPAGTHKKVADKPKVTVHINRIEVQSDDPDRIAFGLVESFRDAAKNPSSAFATLREG